MNDLRLRAGLSQRLPRRVLSSGAILVVILAGGCGSTASPNDKKLSLLEAQFGISPTLAEVACIAKQRGVSSRAATAAELGRWLDACLTRQHVVGALGRTYARSQPAERQACVGRLLSGATTFEIINGASGSAGADANAQLILARSLSGALSQCGIVASETSSTSDYLP